jgi:hypothetical protein
MIRATVVTDRALAHIQRLTPVILNSLRRNFTSYLTEVQAHIKVTKLSGWQTANIGLNRRTGTLSRSVHVQPLEEDSTGITGEVTAGRDAPYGKIHEEGEHHFMAPALREKTEAFYEMVRKAVAEGAS